MHLCKRCRRFCSLVTSHFFKKQSVASPFNSSPCAHPCLRFHPPIKVLAQCHQLRLAGNAYASAHARAIATADGTSFRNAISSADSAAFKSADASANYIPFAAPDCPAHQGTSTITVRGALEFAYAASFTTALRAAHAIADSHPYHWAYPFPVGRALATPYACPDDWPHPLPLHVAFGEPYECSFQATNRSAVAKPHAAPHGASLGRPHRNPLQTADRTPHSAPHARADHEPHPLAHWRALSAPNVSPDGDAFPETFGLPERRSLAVPVVCPPHSYAQPSSLALAYQ